MVRQSGARFFGGWVRGHLLRVELREKFRQRALELRCDTGRIGFVLQGRRSPKDVS